MGKVFILLFVVIIGNGTLGSVFNVADNEIKALSSRMLRLEKSGQDQQRQIKNLVEKAACQQNEIKHLTETNRLLQIQIMNLEDRDIVRQNSIQRLVKRTKLQQSQIKSIHERCQLEQNPIKPLDKRNASLKNKNTYSRVYGNSQKIVLRFEEKDRLKPKLVRRLQKRINQPLDNQTPLQATTYDKTDTHHYSRQQEDQAIKQTAEDAVTFDYSKSANRVRRAESDVEIAFFATLSADQMHVGVHQTIMFDHVVTNIGNGYHNHVGTFIAPVSGTYVFSVTLRTGWGEFNVYEIVKNGSVISGINNNAANANDVNGSQTFILQLNQNDDVIIRNRDLDKHTVGRHYSTFAGFLLRQHYQNEIIG